MANIFTYSFEDTEVTVNHPSFGSYSAYGTGIGNITISMSNDITTHEVSADTAVVVSRSVKKNGAVALDILQSSGFNTWLNGFANFLETCDISVFADANMIIRNRSSGETFTCTGVTHQKKPDTQFQSTAQNKTWTLMCGNIDLT